MLIKYIKMKKKTECLHASYFAVCRFATCLCSRWSSWYFCIAYALAPALLGIYKRACRFKFDLYITGNWRF